MQYIIFPKGSHEIRKTEPMHDTRNRQSSTCHEVKAIFGQVADCKVGTIFIRQAKNEIMNKESRCLEVASSLELVEKDAKHG